MKRLVYSMLMIVLPLMGRAQVPDFTVTDTDGITHNLYAHLDSNRFVVLDFFFTNCSFCQYYAPQVDQSFEDFGCNRGNTYFLGIDYGDSNQAVADFRQAYGMGYPAASGLEGGGDSVISLYGVTGFPTLMLISPQKQLLKVITTPATAMVDTILNLAGCTMMPCDAGLGTELRAPSSFVLPNPVRAGESVRLTIDISSATGSEFSLLHPDGRTVHQLRLTPGSGVLNIPQNTAAGVYLLRISSEQFRGTCRLLVTK